MTITANEVTNQDYIWSVTLPTTYTDVGPGATAIVDQILEGLTDEYLPYVSKGPFSVIYSVTELADASIAAGACRDATDTLVAYVTDHAPALGVAAVEVVDALEQPTDVFNFHVAALITPLSGHPFVLDLTFAQFNDEVPFPYVVAPSVWVETTLAHIKAPVRRRVSPADVQLMLRQHCDIRLIVDGYDNDGTVVTVAHIAVEPDDRRRGIATGVMNTLIREADSAGWTLALTPESIDGSLTTNQLTAFYHRLGFRHNTGTRRDTRTRESMVRQPDGARR